ncbi:MAG: DNRLRE domain-containing protein [Candidatus Brocadiia bacterium]
MRRPARWLPLAALAALAAAGTANAATTKLQNGAAPSPGYAGCTDTWISDEKWERKRNYGEQMTLRCGGKRRILLRFDLSPIPRDHAVRQALLCLPDAGYPRRRQGQWSTYFQCRRLTASWKEDANWREHTRTDYEKSDAGDWKRPGGDVDESTDFGHGANGIIATDRVVVRGGAHLHVLDVTAVVRRWHRGDGANCGLVLEAPDNGPGCRVASSEWYVPTHRPALLVAHAPPGQAAEPIRLGGQEAEPGELHPVAATADAGQVKGRYGTVRVGQGEECALRGQSTDAYVKEAVLRFPGTWGWMTQCRVGGAAGDFSRALLLFDLGTVPRDSSIRSARLVLSLVSHTSRQAGSYRYGAFLFRLPETPGWTAAEVTAAERKAGVPWPEGGVVAASDPRPLAIGTLTTRKDERGRTVPATLEFDLTGAVRAWVQGKVPNCGIVLDNRLEGGAYDFYGCRSFHPRLRPRLEIVHSPVIEAEPAPLEVTPEPPPEDAWVEPMRRVHERFDGRAGTLAQYGDSITVTMAFLAPLSWGKGIEPKNCPPEVQREMGVVADYADRELWRKWKGGQWGNTGMMMSDWLLAHVDEWQRKMDPEAAVVMFGTNDIGRIWPPEYTENMAAALRRMMADGTVPMLTSIPPAAKGGYREYWLAALSIAHGLRVPLIDYQGEILRRRPDDWNGKLPAFADRKGYQVLTLVAGDGTHPSNPKEYVNDFSEKALSTSGYSLRNYMTLRMYYRVITEVLKPGKEP